MIYKDRNGDKLQNGDLITTYLSGDYSETFNVTYWHNKSHNAKAYDVKQYDPRPVLKGVHIPNTITEKIVTGYDVDYWLVVQEWYGHYFTKVMLSNGFVYFNLPFMNIHLGHDEGLYHPTPEESLDHAKNYLTNKYMFDVKPFDAKHGKEIYVESMNETYRVARILEAGCSYDVCIFTEDYHFYANSSDWRMMYEDDIYLQLPVIHEK